MKRYYGGAFFNGVRCLVSVWHCEDCRKRCEVFGNRCARPQISLRTFHINSGLPMNLAIRYGFFIPLLRRLLNGLSFSIKVERGAMLQLQ